MITASWDIRALQVLDEFFGVYPQLIRDSSVDVVKTLRNLSKGGTPVKTGHAKSEWSEVQSTIGVNSLSFENRVSYIGILEHGLYPRVGPRTVATGRGIFSKQAPEGMIYPLMEDQDLARDLMQTIVTSIQTWIERRGGQ